MKKSKRVLIMIISIFLVCAVTIILVTTFLFNNRIEIQESTIDNTYNNMIANGFPPGFLQLKSTLFFHHHSKLGLNEGTFICENGKTDKVSDSSISLRYVLNHQLLDLSSDPAMYFDISTKKFQPFTDTSLPRESEDDDLLIIDNRLYSIKNSTLFIFEESQWKKVADSRDLEISGDMFLWSNFYLDGNFIYYTNHTDKVSELCRYDCVRKTIERFPCDLGTEFRNEFFVYKDCVYILCSLNTIKKYDTNTKQETILFKAQTGTVEMNCYQDNVFFSISSHDGEKGFYWIDSLRTVKKITDIEAGGICVLDEEYVYFYDMNFSLYRARLSDFSLEKFFA